MPFDFPASPTNGQVYSPSGGPDYVYRTASTAWEIQTGGTSSAFVAKVGDTMTGHLTLPTGPAAASAVRKDYVDTQDGLAVAKTGGIMTGALTLTAANSVINLQKVNTGQNFIYGMTGAQYRWSIILGNSISETGGNLGSDFSIWRYDDSGTPINAAMTIERKTGLTRIVGTLAQQDGDFWVQRAAPEQNMGNIRFGTDVNRYLWFDGTDFHFGGGHLILDNNRGINCYSGQFTTFVNAGGNIGAGGTIFAASAMGAKGTVYIDAVNSTNNPAVHFRNEFNTTAGYLFWNHTADEMEWFHYSGQKIRLAAWGIASSHDSCYKPTGGPWITTSDARIKDVHGDYTGGLNEVLALHPVLYSYKGNDSFGKAEPDAPNPSLNATVVGKEFIGLVAQEAEVPMPEMVKQVPGFINGIAVTDLRTLDTGPLVYALVNSCKELAARNDALEARLAALETQLAAR